MNYRTPKTNICTNNKMNSNNLEKRAHVEVSLWSTNHNLSKTIANFVLRGPQIAVHIQRNPMSEETRSNEPLK